MGQDGGLDKWNCDVYENRTHFTPCLFNLFEDEREMNDLAPQKQGKVKDMWTVLNETVQWTSFVSRSPPDLLGPCNSTCSHTYWSSFGGDPTSDEPQCGVPGC